MMELRPYAPPSFFTTQGAWAKRRQLEAKGFPTDLRNWRFVTLTVDPKIYPDPFMAWALGKRHLRQFVYLLKKKYNIRRWCWKMEFHEPDEDGRVYPHWHLLFDFKAKIDKDEIAALWGKGRTNIKRVDNESFEYLFKYAVKAVDCIPQWILDRTNVRLFQTSRGFFPAKTSAGDVDKTKDEVPSPRQTAQGPGSETQNYRINDETIGERLERWSRYVVSRSISPEGQVRHRTFEMTCRSWGQLLVQLGRIKIRGAIPSSVLDVTENRIQTTCLQALQSYLPAFT
jgi:hypothetical protein